MNIFYKYKVFKTSKGFQPIDTFSNGLILANHNKESGNLFYKENDNLIFVGTCSTNQTRIETAKSWSNEFIKDFINHFRPENEPQFHENDMRFEAFN